MSHPLRRTWPEPSIRYKRHQLYFAKSSGQALRSGTRPLKGFVILFSLISVININFQAKDVFKKPFTPLTLTDKQLAAKPGENKLPLEPLYKLDRDSMKFLPRDSLAWITHLPRYL